MNTVTQWITVSFIIYYLLYHFIAISVTVCWYLSVGCMLWNRNNHHSIGQRIFFRPTADSNWHKGKLSVLANAYVVGNIKEPCWAGLLCNVVFAALYHVPACLSHVKNISVSMQSKLNHSFEVQVTEV